MKNNMTVLCGISCSGKSTYAHSRWLENPLKTIIVNRDKIRELLFGFTEGSGRFTNYLFFDKFRKKWDKQINNFVKRGLIEKDADTIKGYVFWTLTNQAKEEFSDITKFK